MEFFSRNSATQVNIGLKDLRCIDGNVCLDVEMEKIWRLQRKVVPNLMSGELKDFFRLLSI